MENEEAVLALAALAQPTRLEAFRTLVRHVPEGLAAGELARLLEVPQHTLFRDVTLFLLRDCCGGRPEVCDPVVETLQACCSPKRKERSRA